VGASGEQSPEATWKRKLKRYENQLRKIKEEKKSA